MKLLIRLVPIVAGMIFNFNISYSSQYLKEKNKEPNCCIKLNDKREYTEKDKSNFNAESIANIFSIHALNQWFMEIIPTNNNKEKFNCFNSSSNFFMDSKYIKDNPFLTHINLAIVCNHTHLTQLDEQGSLFQYLPISINSVDIRIFPHDKNGASTYNIDENVIQRILSILLSKPNLKRLVLEGFVFTDISKCRERLDLSRCQLSSLTIVGSQVDCFKLFFPLLRDMTYINELSIFSPIDIQDIIDLANYEKEISNITIGGRWVVNGGEGSSKNAEALCALLGSCWIKSIKLSSMSWGEANFLNDKVKSAIKNSKIKELGIDFDKYKIFKEVMEALGNNKTIEKLLIEINELDEGFDKYKIFKDVIGAFQNNDTLKSLSMLYYDKVNAENCDNVTEFVCSITDNFKSLEKLNIKFTTFGFYKLCAEDGEYFEQMVDKVKTHHSNKRPLKLFKLSEGKFCANRVGKIVDMRNIYYMYKTTNLYPSDVESAIL